MLDWMRRRMGADSRPNPEADEWRRRYESLREQFHDEQRRDREERSRMKAQSERRSRRIPSTISLRHAFRARLARARDYAATPDVISRRDAFASRTPAYVDAIHSVSSLASQARQTIVDGLEWWVPAPPTQSAASIERSINKQSLPYRAISQTRDLALGGIVLDIGGNIGATAIPRAVLGDARLVLCAEPDGLNYRCLVANVVGNGLAGLVLPEQTAISDRVGTVEIARGKMPGSHRIVHATPEPSLSVPSTTIDAWVARHGIDVRDVTFVKIDTQGSEVHVLSGASTLLAQPGVGWQVEIAPGLLRMAGHEPSVLYALLQAHFTHFIDLNADASGPRVREIGDLTTALAYLEHAEQLHTDVLAYRAG